MALKDFALVPGVDRGGGWGCLSFKLIDALWSSLFAVPSVMSSGFKETSVTVVTSLH